METLVTFLLLPRKMCMAAKVCILIKVCCFYINLYNINSNHQDFLNTQYMSDEPEAKYLRIITLFKFQFCEVDTLITSILQM